MTMENELWKKVYQYVFEIVKNKSIKRATYSHADIILTYLWAVINDRPVYWACKKKNWPIYYRKRKLPNPSTMTRRLRSSEIQMLLKQIERSLIGKFPRSICRWIDAKPLPVGGASKDKHAAFGFGASIIAKGYKLFAIADLNQGFVNWTVKPMNKSESRVARELIVGIEKEGYLVGDGEYDKNHLYEIAGHLNIQLIAPKRIRNAKGLGHRRHSLYRLRAMELQKRKFGESLIFARTIIERMFGNLVTFEGGLKPLPHWVRTLPRVERWVRGKMILYHLWRYQNHEAKCA
jgi:hypothetical protein